jgi:hypothetical protein
MNSIPHNKHAYTCSLNDFFELVSWDDSFTWIIPISEKCCVALVYEPFSDYMSVAISAFPSILLAFRNQSA